MGAAEHRWAGVAAAVVLLALTLGAASAWGQDQISGDRYANPRYGIEITKPSSWHFITAQMIVDLAKRSSGGGSLRGEDDPVKLAGFAVIVSKVASLGREIAPQVVLLVHERQEPPQDLVRACEGLRTGMNDPETVTETQTVSLAGRPAARLDFRGNIAGATVRAAALCTFRGRQAFVVAAQALTGDFEGALPAFESILASFKLR
jgi:hypothetical protein